MNPTNNQVCARCAIGGVFDIQFTFVKRDDEITNRLFELVKRG